MQTETSPSPPVIQRYFEVSLFLLVTVGFLALASTGKLDLFSLLLVGGGLAAKALRYRRHQEPELSPQAVTSLTWFYFAFYLADLFLLSGEFQRATTHLVLFIALVKVFSARTNRDYLWLALIAFMEILAAATLTVDATFLMFFFVFLVVGVSTFISYEIKRSAEAARSTALAPGTGMAQRLERALLTTSLAVAMGTLALAGVIFFILPRFTTGYLSAYAFQPEPISGFSDEVTLNDIGRIKQNPAVVMRIRAEGDDPQQLENLKWRGLALTKFDGQRWFVHSRQSKVVLRSAGGRFYPPRATLRDFPPRARLPQRRIAYRVLLEPISTDALFAASVPLEVRGRFRFLGQDDTGSLVHFRQHHAQVSYEVASDVASAPPGLLRGIAAAYPEKIQALYLQLPPLDPRVEELARELAAGRENAYDRARTLERYLRTTFGYTLELPQEPHLDPIAHFLFERRKGHCEYFSASMAVMLRSLGIPARPVNGFLTGEYNEVGGNYIVRASDAHSWVEVYFPGVGWVEFDPTPPDPNARTRTWWTKVQHYADAFDLWWDEWVVNYDFLHQRQLARNARAALGWARASRQWFRQTRRSLTAQLHNFGNRLLSSPYAAPGGILVALILLALARGQALATALRARWLLRGGGVHSLRADQAAVLYRRLLAILRRQGYRKRPAQTPLEFAASLPPAELAGNVEEFTQLYNQLRFGHATPPPGRLAELLQAVQQWKPERHPAR